MRVDHESESLQYLPRESLGALTQLVRPGRLADCFRHVVEVVEGALQQVLRLATRLQLVLEAHRHEIIELRQNNNAKKVMRACDTYCNCHNFLKLTATKAHAHKNSPLRIILLGAWKTVQNTCPIGNSPGRGDLLLPSFKNVHESTSFMLASLRPLSVLFI